MIFHIITPVLQIFMKNSMIFHINTTVLQIFMKNSIFEGFTTRCRQKRASKITIHDTYIIKMIKKWQFLNKMLIQWHKKIQKKMVLFNHFENSSGS